MATLADSQVFDILIATSVWLSAKFSSTRSTGGFKAAVVGSLGSHPYNKKKGLGFLTTYMICKKNMRELFFPDCSTIFDSMSSKVQIYRSTRPSVCGWYAVVLTFFIPNSLYNSNIIFR